MELATAIDSLVNKQAFGSYHCPSNLRYWRVIDGQSVEFLFTALLHRCISRRHPQQREKNFTAAWRQKTFISCM